MLDFGLFVRLHDDCFVVVVLVVWIWFDFVVYICVDFVVLSDFVLDCSG